MAAKKRRKRIFPRVVAVIIVALVVYVGFVFLRNWRQLQTLQQQREALAGQLGELQDENENLQREIDFSQTPDFIERMAREFLGWVMPGEIKYVEGETPAPDATPAPTVSADETPAPDGTGQPTS